MTFGFSGFGKSLSMLGGGHSAGHGFGGKLGLLGGKGGLFGGKGQDCDRDDDRDDHHDHGQGSGSNGHSGGDTAGGTGSGQAGTGWPSIPANTAGITFHVDYEGDGVTDSAVPIGRSSDTKTFEDYLAKARDQIATDNPDVDPKEVIIKATITTQSGEESYYHFTGLEEGSASGDDGDDDTEDDTDDDHHGAVIRAAMVAAIAGRIAGGAMTTTITHKMAVAMEMAATVMETTAEAMPISFSR